jgi:hypothetical protein
MDQGRTQQGNGGAGCADCLLKGRCQKALYTEMLGLDADQGVWDVETALEELSKYGHCLQETGHFPVRSRGGFETRILAAQAGLEFLRSHSADDYTPENIVKLYDELANDDGDPIEHLPESYREIGFGLTISMFGFAYDEASRAVKQADGACLGALTEAKANIGSALVELPNYRVQTLRRLASAQDQLMQAHLLARAQVYRETVRRGFLATVLGNFLLPKLSKSTVEGMPRRHRRTRSSYRTGS